MLFAVKAAALEAFAPREGRFGWVVLNPILFKKLAAKLTIQNRAHGIKVQILSNTMQVREVK